MFSQDNPLMGLILEINEATSGFLIYCVLLIIYVVATYVIMRRTQDIAKSVLNGLHITMILSLLLFYVGKLVGYVLVPNVLMLSILVIEAVGVGLLYFQRMKGG